MKKKVMLIGTIIILILLATFGASVALFNGVRTGSSLSSIKVGDLTFKYTEVTGIGNGINLEDPEAISDEEGKQLNTWFDFKIDANLVNSDMIYEVSVEPTNESTINLDGVKIYLTELVGNEEVDINSNYNGLGKVKVISDYDNGIIYQERILKNTKNYEKNFRVRIWISEDVDIYTDDYMGTKGIFKINVNSKSDISMVDATIPVPEITGGTGETWVAEPQTISIVKTMPVVYGIKEYEYYLTDDENDIPNDLTIETGTKTTDDTSLTVSNPGTTYIYYRSVTMNDHKSAWSIPQIVNIQGSKIITFDAGDGVILGSSEIEASIGKMIDDLPSASKVGYNFDGWYTEDNELFDSQTIVKGRDDMTLYAKYIPITYTIRYNANGGSGSMSNQTFNYDEPRNLAANSFTYSGKTFLGWSTTSGTQLLYYSAAEKHGANEFMQYGVDMSTYFDRYGAVKYSIMVDARSANTSKSDIIVAYCQNGSNQKWQFSYAMTVKTTYQTFIGHVTPNRTYQSGVTASQLAFYGTYNTGNIPYVKNVYWFLGDYYRNQDTVSNLTTIDNENIDLYAVWK